MTNEANDAPNNDLHHSKAKVPYTIDVPLPKPEMQVLSRLRQQSVQTRYRHLYGQRGRQRHILSPGPPGLAATQTSPRAHWALGGMTFWPIPSNIRLRSGCQIGIFWSFHFRPLKVRPSHIALNPSPDHWLYVEFLLHESNGALTV
jgi:hypothetical protein